MHTNQWLAGIIVVVVVIGGGWYWYGHRAPAAPTGNPIKIGALLSLTGVAASYGESAKNSIELAAEDINKSGGIDGRPVQIVYEDDHTDAATAVSAFQKLTAIDHVDGIVGGLFDFATKPLFPLADSTKTALISPINFRIAGGFELSDYSFVMLPDFSKVIEKLHDYLAASGTKKLAVVHFRSVFGQEISDTLSGVMTGLGRPAVVDEAYNQIGNNDFKTIILKLKQQDVDAVFLDMVDVDPVTFVTQARALDYHPTIISYHGIVDSFATAKADPALLDGAVILDWEFSPPQFASEYQEQFKSEPAHSAIKSYQAVYVLAHAIAEAQGHDAVAPYLASHTLETPQGPVSFNATHSTDSTPVMIEVVKDGLVTEWK